MKRINFSRRQILRTIRAACIALFFAACAGRAGAAPTESADFVISPDGTTVTVAGVPNNGTTAFFTDPSPNTYAFTIFSAANIGNTSNAFHSGNLISFDNGSVNNAGTLTASNYAITINSTSTAVSSSVTNSGTITSTGSIAINIDGNGSVNNVSGGTISGVYEGVYINGANGTSSVTNAGSITATSTSNYAAGVGLGGTNSNYGTSNFSVVNSNSISGSAIYGSGSVSAYGTNAGSYNGNISIQNTSTGTMSGYAKSTSSTATAYGISASSYYGNVSITNAAGGSVTGTAIGAGLETGYGIAASTDFFDSYGTITINNGGMATGIGGNGDSTSGYSGAKGYGISASSYYGSIVITNSGTASGSGLPADGTASGYGIFASSNSSQSGSAYGNITITNSGTATGTASVLYDGAANAFGISASASNYGNIIVTNNNIATGTGTSAGNYSATAFGISASAHYGNVTVTNNGTATGTASAPVTQFGDTSATASGYGIAASSAKGTTTIVNNGTATGTGSGYYSGTGYGIYSSNSNGGYGGPIVITNNNMATGTGTAVDGSGAPTGKGYGISASSYYGNVTVTNVGTATGSGTAIGAGGTAGGYGYGISASSYNGNVTIANAGTASGTGSGYYSGTGSGLYAYSQTGAISITNSGTATGFGSTSSYYGVDASSFAYGIYAKAAIAGSITINNSGIAIGAATNGSVVLGTIVDYSKNPAFGSGILAISTGSANILINNSGTASGYGTVNGSGSGYGYGVSIKSTNNGSVTINNSGVVTGTGSSYAGTGSGYGIYFQNGGTGSGTLAITNFITGVIQGTGFATSGFSGSGYSYGIYMQNGTGPATLTNSGVITGVNTSTISSVYSGIGISATGYTGSITVNEFGGAVTTGAPTTTGSGPYLPGSIAIVLGSGNNAVNIVGQANDTGLVDGGSSGNNTLSLHLAGMTPAQKAALQAALVLTTQTDPGSASGPIFAGGVTYSWVDFENGSGSFVSLEQAVDPGLLSIATKIDNLPTYLGVAYGPFYMAAASNPEAALNSLVGREFDDALGVISKNDATALSEVWDSRAFDLRTGTGGFDLSGLNIMSGSMIASLGATENTLDRLMGASALGGTTMSDSKEAVTPPANTNRWGAWASGTVMLADESTTASGPGFNYTTGSPTIGADYRVCNNFALGALLNFSTTGANFADGSRLGVQTGLAALYGTWSDGPWYVNGLAGGGISSYDNNRVTLTGDTANSSPDGDEVLANLTGGYDFKLGCGWKISPEGGFLYTHVTENGYTESGAGAYDLTLPDQNIDSLRSKLGFRVIDNFTWDGIAFTPQIRASWYHEILDDSRGVTTSLGGAPALGSFVVQTNSEGRDFADLGAGLSATPAELSGDVTFFVNYDAQVGQDNFVSHTVNGGLRVNF